jgi:hypothetical protein
MSYEIKSLSSKQLDDELLKLKKQIFFLLLIVDPDTKSTYKNINVEDVFNDLFRKIDALNVLFCNPPGFVNVLSSLVTAEEERLSEDYDFALYRKYILDAGGAVERMRATNC